MTVALVCEIAGIIFFFFGLLFMVVAVMVSKKDYSGELQIDDEKELVQVVFTDPKALHEVVHDKNDASFKIVRKSIEYDLSLTQEKQRV